MRCKRCGDEDEMQLKAATLNGEARYLCQKCGGDEQVMVTYGFGDLKEM
jgi:transposase-like protein